MPTPMSTPALSPTPPALDDLILRAGRHPDRTPDRICLLEAAAWWAGEPHSATPDCVSSVLVFVGHRLNDCLDHDLRQQLRAYVPAMVATRGDGRDTTRAWAAVNWTTRVDTPAWLRAVGLHDDAAGLRQLAPVDNPAAARAAAGLLRHTETRLTAARRDLDVRCGLDGHIWPAVAPASCISVAAAIGLPSRQLLDVLDARDVATRVCAHAAVLLAATRPDEYDATVAERHADAVRAYGVLVDGTTIAR